MSGIEIAGITIGGVGLAATLVQTYKDLAGWKTEDLQVDRNWLELAMKNGRIDGAPEDYHWSRAESVETRREAGTHEIVFAAATKGRIKYRIVRGYGKDRLVLMQKTDA